jgi:hypothetical protein
VVRGSAFGQEDRGLNWWKGGGHHDRLPLTHRCATGRCSSHPRAGSRATSPN